MSINNPNDEKAVEGNLQYFVENNYTDSIDIEHLKYRNKDPYSMVSRVFALAFKTNNMKAISKILGFYDVPYEDLTIKEQIAYYHLLMKSKTI